MKVAVYYNNSDIRIEERPVPQITDGEILIKVAASGICGTDVMEWYRVKKAPRIMGHEIAGEIVESKTEKFQVGQRVFVSHHVPCENCKYCRSDNHTACDTLHKGNYDPGGYSEFVRVPVENVEKGTYILPDAISYEEATMIEPLACTVRAQRIIGVKDGQTILILGSGVSGLTNIELAKLRQAHVIATDIDDYRLEKAYTSGADEIIHANNLKDITADRVIICTGAKSALNQAFESIDKKGTILFFAISGETIEIPIAKMWRNEVTITSSYGAAPRDLKEAIELISNKKVNVRDMITHTLPLSEIQAGFALVRNAKESLKVVLIP